MKYLKDFYLVSLMLSALFLGVGCVNLKPKPDSVKLYALGPVSVADHGGSHAERPSLYVARPDIPSYLSGNQIQWRMGDGRVKEALNARWAENLEEGIARALSEYLASEGASSMEGYYPWPYMSRDIPKLNVRFQKLDALDDGRFQVVAHWTLTKSGEKLASGSFEEFGGEWSPKDIATLIAAFNRSLEQLAEDIVLSM